MPDRLTHVQRPGAPGREQMAADFPAGGDLSVTYSAHHDRCDLMRHWWDTMSQHPSLKKSAAAWRIASLIISEARYYLNDRWLVLRFTVGELAERLAVHANTVQQALDKLVGAAPRLLEPSQIRGNGDRRCWVLYASEAAARLGDSDDQQSFDFNAKPLTDSADNAAPTVLSGNGADEKTQWARPRAGAPARPLCSPPQTQPEKPQSARPVGAVCAGGFGGRLGLREEERKFSSSSSFPDPERAQRQDEIDLLCLFGSRAEALVAASELPPKIIREVARAEAERGHGPGDARLLAALERRLRREQIKGERSAAKQTAATPTGPDPAADRRLVRSLSAERLADLVGQASAAVDHATAARWADLPHPAEDVDLRSVVARLARQTTPEPARV